MSIPLLDLQTENSSQRMNLSELMARISTDHQCRSVLLSLWRNGTEEGNKAGTESSRPTLDRLEEAGLITNAVENHAIPKPILTEQGKLVAVFLEQYLAIDELNEMFDRMPLQPDSAFLDLGCGAGPALVEAGKFSPRLVVGVDIDRQSLLAAKGIMASSCSGAYALIQADMTRLPFKNGAFSHVCSRLSTPYVRQDRAITEIGRVLSRGGKVFLQLHGFRFYWKLFCRDLGKWKRVVLNGFCLLNGLVFHLTGRQLQVRLRSGIYQELAQTESGMRHLLAGAGMTFKSVDKGKLFRILAVKEPVMELELKLEMQVLVGWKEVEESLDSGGLSRGWEELLPRDSIATFSQTPLWCVTWYRNYQAGFEPFLLTAKHKGQLVGLAPLAKERSTGRIVFAGDDMADYRDFVCADGFRRAAIELFMPRIMSETPNGVFVVGQTQPESETPELVRRWAINASRMWTMTRSHPCRRVRLGSSDEITDLYKKKTLRQAIAYYKRRGGFRVKRICESWEWDILKEPFFQQQLLRQAFGERDLSFGDPVKQSFYSQLFESKAPEIYFSGLWSADKAIAFMFCFSYRGVLHYGAPSFDPLEGKHSPGLVHILEVIKQCQDEGYREVDLTIGSASFKSRFANYSTTLPTVDVYCSLPAFGRSILKKIIADYAKLVLYKITGSEDTWETMKDRLVDAKQFRDRIKQTPFCRLMSVALSRLWQLVFYRYTGVIYKLLPGELIPAESIPNPGETCEFSQNRLEGFLSLQGRDRRAISKLIQRGVKRIADGETLHAVLVNGRLAHNGWSYRPKGPAWLPETETNLDFDDGAVTLYDFTTFETYSRRHLYRANLAHIIKNVFAAGAKSIYIVCEKSNTASRRGIISVGFKACATHRMTRVLGWKRRQISQAKPANHE